MKEIITYETVDGKTFEDKDEAIEHERNLDFLTWVTRNPLNSLNPIDILGWLTSNSLTVSAFLGATVYKKDIVRVLSVDEFQVLYSDMLDNDVPVFALSRAMSKSLGLHD